MRDRTDLERRVGHIAWLLLRRRRSDRIAEYVQSSRAAGRLGRRLRQQGQSVVHESVDNSRRACHVVDVSHTTAGVHGHSRYVARCEHGWWLGGPASDLPAPVPVRRVPDDVVGAGGAVGCGAQDSVWSVGPALGVGGRANGVFSSGR